MPTVDEMGRAALQELASLHSETERARAQARIAARRADEARSHYERLANDSIAAARAAKAAIGAPDGPALFDRMRGLHGAAQIAFRAYARARLRSDRLAREAARIERSS